MIEDEINDLLAKSSDPAPTNRAAPKWAAIDKKQKAYEKSVEEYKTQQRVIDEEYRYLKEVKLEELRKKIEEKEQEILLINEKIRLKLKIVKERQSKIERYEPEPGDAIDQKFADYFNVPGKRVPIQRIEKNEYMFGTMRLTTRPNPSKKGDFIATILKDNSEIESAELFGRISDGILSHLDELHDENELLVQEDKILGMRQTELSPQGMAYKKSPTGEGAKKFA